MNIPRDTIRLAPCNHGEAATRMILHLADAVDEGYNNALSRTVDTDVVVLAVAGAAKLNIQKMWLAFGKGPWASPSGAYIISYLHWLWHGVNLRHQGQEDSIGYLESFWTRTTNRSENVAVLERFAILLYDRKSDLVDIDEARQELFRKRGRIMETIPLT